jgi:hypothetical protein
MHSHPASVVYYLTDAKLKIIYSESTARSIGAPLSAGRIISASLEWLRQTDVYY